MAHAGLFLFAFLAGAARYISTVPRASGTPSIQDGQDKNLAGAMSEWAQNYPLRLSSPLVTTHLTLEKKKEA